MNFFTYAVSSSRVLFIEADSTSPSVGSLEHQWSRAESLTTCMWNRVAASFCHSEKRSVLSLPWRRA